MNAKVANVGKETGLHAICRRQSDKDGAEILPNKS